MKETEQTLFLKSNILHIRTNEGEFEVSNPGTLPNNVFPCGWSGDVELIESCIKGSCAEANECIQPHYCVAKKLARLIPEEKKEFKPAQPTPNFPRGGMSFTESAYKTVSSNTQSCGKFEIKSHYDFEPVESSEPQEKSIESEKYELRRILQMQVNCLREDEMDNSDAVAIRGTTAQRIMKFLDPVSAPSESQEEFAISFAKFCQVDLKGRTFNDLMSEFKATRKPE